MRRNDRDGALCHRVRPRRGELDDVHEYDRASARFQQVLSQAWFATRTQDGLDPAALAARTGGHSHADVLADMLVTGALNQNRGVVFPNDSLIEEGDARRITASFLAVAAACRC